MFMTVEWMIGLTTHTAVRESVVASLLFPVQNENVAKINHCLQFHEISLITTYSNFKKSLDFDSAIRVFLLE